MTCRLRIVQISGAVLGLLAMSAVAAPTVFSDNSRMHGNGVHANICVDIPHLQIQRCADVTAWEDHDIKGNFRFTGIEINYSYDRLFDDGSSISLRLWMFCHAGLESIKVEENHVTLEAVLHPNGPECDSWGVREDCDASGNCGSQARGFPEPTIITGEWIDPVNTSNAVVNRTDDFFDPWSETSHRVVNHCNERGRDVMTSGGFSVDFGTAVRHFPFEGFDTQGWTHYWLRSCNNNSKVK